MAFVGKVLTGFGPQVFPAALGGGGFTSGESATAGNIIFSLDSADTFPSATTPPSKSAALAFALSRWRPQHRDLPQHAAKQPPRQRTLRQQQPVVTCVLNQPSAGLHHPPLQAGQRPLPDRRGQRQPPPQVPEVISDQAQPQPHLVGAKAVTGKPRHLHCLLTLFNPLVPLCRACCRTAPPPACGWAFPLAGSITPQYPPASSRRKLSPVRLPLRTQRRLRQSRRRRQAAVANGNEGSSRRRSVTPRPASCSTPRPRAPSRAWAS